MNPENKDERRVGENRGRFLARRWLEVLRELPRTPEDKREIQAALPATRSSVAQHVMKDTTSDGLMESRVGSEEEAQCAKIVMPAKSAKRQGHLVEGGGARTFAFSSIQVFVHVYISAQIIRTFPILLAVPVRCQAKRSRTFGLRTPLDMAGQEQKERLMKALARYLSRGGGTGAGPLAHNTPSNPGWGATSSQTTCLFVGWHGATWRQHGRRREGLPAIVPPEVACFVWVWSRPWGNSIIAAFRRRH